MKNFLKLIALGTIPFVTYGCGDSASDIAEQIEAATSTYDSFDLTCDFDALTGSDDVEEDVTASLTEDESSETSYNCEDVAEQFAVLVEEYDSDGDDELSDEELAEAEEGFEEAQLEAVDTDGDGTISDDERTKWRTDVLPGRASKRESHFKESCEAIGKTESECKAFRDKRKEKHKKAIQDRFDEFDTDSDGTLSKEERDAMRTSLKAERKTARESFVKKHDSDGDGKIGDSERKKRRSDREEKQGGHRKTAKEKS